MRTPVTELGFQGGVTVDRLHTRDNHWGRHFGDRCALGEEFLLEVFEKAEHKRSDRRPDSSHDPGPQRPVQRPRRACARTANRPSTL
jgi:hypothetical protein